MSAYFMKTIDSLHRFFARKDVKKAMKAGENLAKIAEIFEVKNYNDDDFR